MSLIRPGISSTSVFLSLVSASAELQLTPSSEQSIWPIIGGMALDWYGVNSGLLACTGVIFIGSVLSAVATNISSWRLMAGGKILQGFGDAVLDSAQRKLLYHYFGTGGLAFAGG